MPSTRWVAARDRVDAWVWDHPWRFAIAVVLWLLAVVHIATTPRFDTNDDIAMQWILQGGYTNGSPSSDPVLSSTLIGIPLHLLYRITDAVPWYGLYLYLVEVIAAVVILRTIARRPWFHASAHGVLSIALLCTILVPAWTRMQFTVAAMLLATSGLLLWSVAIRDEHEPDRLAILGAALLGCSSLIRFNSTRGILLAALPIVAVTIWRRRVLMAHVAPAAVAAAVILGGLGVDALAHRSDDWQAYGRFRDAQGALSGTPEVTLKAPGDALAAAEWTPNDWANFVSYQFLDLETFAPERIEAVHAALPDAPVDLDAARSELVDDLLPLLVALAGLVGWIALTGAWGDRALAAIHLGWTSAILMWLAASARLPFRVSLGLVALTALAILVQREPGDLELRSPRLGAVLLVVASLVALAGTAIAVGDALDATPQNEAQQAVIAHRLSALERLDPDAVYFELPGAIAKEYLSPLSTTAPEVHFVALGGWQALAPPLRDALAERGHADLFDAAGSGEVYLVVDPRFGQAGAVRTFAAQHRGIQLLLQTITEHSSRNYAVLAVDRPGDS